MKGASLLEVIFATALIGLVLMVLLDLFPYSMMSLRQSEQRLQASVLAQSILDECSSMSFKSLIPGSYSAPAPGPYAGFMQDRTIGDRTVLHPSLRITTLPNPPGVKVVRVTIAWTMRGRSSNYVQELRLCDLNR